MPNDKHNTTQQSQRVREFIERPLVVSAKSFWRFGRHLDRELAALVRQWEHTAAPNVRKTPPLRFRAPKPK